MTVYWMGWLSVFGAAFFGCLAALLVALLLRVMRAAMIARRDGNTSTQRIDAHARTRAWVGQQESSRHVVMRPQEVPASYISNAPPVDKPVHTFAEQKPDPGTVLIGPPMVGRYTLRDHLIHYANDDKVWQRLVADFYGRAAQDAVVFEVFQKVARSKGMDVGALVEQVQKHFLAMLIVMTHVGLSVRLRDSLQNSHAFAGISADAYDRTVNVLVKTLTEYGTPQEAFPSLVKMVEELQPYIVTK